MTKELRETVHYVSFVVAGLAFIAALSILFYS